MGLFENIKIAVEGLKLNKMRSFLTMLGIIIGIASVISIVTIGDSLSNSVSKGFENIGSNTVSVGVRPRENVSFQEITVRDYMHISTIDTLKDRYAENIKSIVISGAGSSGKIANGRKNTSVNVEATSEGSDIASNLQILYGRYLMESDAVENKEVAVISDKVVKEIFNGNYEEVLGSVITVDTPTHGSRSYTVVGIYKHENISMGVFGSMPEGATPMYIPYTVVNLHYGSLEDNPEYLSNFSVITNTREDIPYLTKEIANYYNENFYQDNEKAQVETSTISSQLNEINNVMRTISLAIGGIAAISLLVGGIGVMNILLVSVTERTREIGIRKALGAQNKDIQGQFIIESVIICLIGGFIGILLGGIGGYAASHFLESPTMPSISSIIIAFVFSMIIGVFFGYYPASKAAKLNPIDALRYE